MKISSLLLGAAVLFSNTAFANIRHAASNSLECLTKNIYYEAGNQSRSGKIAVGHVTMNRLKNNFANSICGVVYQPHQFSWTRKRRLPKVNVDLWEQSKEVALAILNGTAHDNTSGSTYFHATYVRPRWRGVTHTATIGQHVFYRSR